MHSVVPSKLLKIKKIPLRCEHGKMIERLWVVCKACDQGPIERMKKRVSEIHALEIEISTLLLHINMNFACIKNSIHTNNLSIDEVDCLQHSFSYMQETYSTIKDTFITMMIQSKTRNRYSLKNFKTLTLFKNRLQSIYDVSITRHFNRLQHFLKTKKNKQNKIQY
jgi:hypothetical protein